MNDFAQNIQKALILNHVQPDDILIIAVSGGADSMALLHCCASLHYTCVAAHVNYGLRGSESDQDEQCVRAYCSANQIQLEVLQVNDEHWQLNAGSTQEAARNIRYTWLEDCRLQHHASVILTAHHAVDQTETMLYQFVRGGAGKSIYGMGARTHYLVRPMLAITKAAVMNYVNELSIPWRLDQSNDTTDYTRNRIRHELMPLIELLNPSIHDTIQLRSIWLHEEQKMVDQMAHHFFSSTMLQDSIAETLSIQQLLNSGYMRVLLWKWLSKSGFTSQQVIGIADKLHEQRHTEPIWFASATHEVCIQGDTIACAENQPTKEQIINSIPWSNDFVQLDYCTAEEVLFTADSSRQYLDAARLVFPLTLRVWEHGDTFHPLGAPGQQKVSDFLTHQKTPAWIKKHTAVLTSKNTIASVLGMRISEKFKKTAHTTTCLRIQSS